MSEVILDPTAPKKNKKKHHLLWLWILLGVVFTLVILPISLTYIMFFDSYKADLNIDENYTQEQYTNRLIVDSVDRSPANKEIQFKVSEDDLDQLLYFASQEAIKNSGGTLEQFYVDITDTNYNFYVKVNVPLFQTRICLQTKFSDSINNEDHTQDTFIFEISDIRLGRVGGLKSITTNLLKQYVNAADIQSAFQSAGVNISIDLEKGILSYPHVQLLKDLQNIVGKGEDAGIYFSAMSDFMDNGLVSFNFNNDDAFTGTVDLNPLLTNTNYCTPDKNLNIPLGDYRDKVVSLLNSNIITNEYSMDIYNYLLRGYDDCSDNIKSYLSSKDFSSIDIDDVTAYTGFPLSHIDDINALLIDQINTADILLGKVGKINEDQINEVIKSTNVIGYTYLLQRKTSDTTFKINYLSVDNFYINIVDSHIYMTIGLNINGCETSVIFVADEGSTQDYALSFTMNNNYFGTYACGEELEQLFFDLIENATDNEDWINVDAINHSMNISFSSAIDSSGHKTEIDTYGDTQIKCVGTNLSAVGYLDVTIVPH